MPSPVLQEGATAPILLPPPGRALQTPGPSGLLHFSASLPTTSLPPGDTGVRSDSSKALLSLLSSVKKAKRQDGGGGEASPVIPFGPEAAVPSWGQAGDTAGRLPSHVTAATREQDKEVFTSLPLPPTQGLHHTGGVSPPLSQL